MPRLISTVFAVFALALAASAANAQVYKWKDANGTMHYSDQAPTAGAKYEKVQINSSVTTPVTAPTAKPVSASTAASATVASKQAPAASKVVDTPGNRVKLCKDLGSNIALLNGQQPLSIGDDNGAQKSMSDDERRQQLATAQAQQKQYCTGG